MFYEITLADKWRLIGVMKSNEDNRRETVTSFQSRCDDGGELKKMVKFEILPLCKVNRTCS